MMSQENRRKALENFKKLSTEEYDKLSTDERTKYDELVKLKETEEQEQLPYRWTQTLHDLDVTLQFPQGTKAKDLDVVLEKDYLRVGFKNQEPIIDGKLHAEIKLDDSAWVIDFNGFMQITLVKRKGMEWWKNVIAHHPEIDTTKIQPENSKLSDLDGEVRAMVEKIIYDQDQRAQNKPTSDEMKNLEILKSFKEKHPELDLSNVDIV